MSTFSCIFFHRKGCHATFDGCTSLSNTFEVFKIYYFTSFFTPLDVYGNVRKHFFCWFWLVLKIMKISLLFWNLKFLYAEFSKIDYVQMRLKIVISLLVSLMAWDYVQTRTMSFCRSLFAISLLMPLIAFARATRVCQFESHFLSTHIIKFSHAYLISKNKKRATRIRAARFFRLS